MIDQWPTAKRLAAYTRATSASPQLLQLRNVVGYSDGTTREMGGLQIIHAKSDMDISFHQTEIICAEVLGEDRAEQCVAGQDGLLLDVRDEGRLRVRARIVEHGGEFGLSFELCDLVLAVLVTDAVFKTGHNRIMTYSDVAVAVARGFEGK
jgi:abhydrolase domain-containing protein 12